MVVELSAIILLTMVPVPKAKPVGPYCTSHSVAVAQFITHDKLAVLKVVPVTDNAPGSGQAG